MATTTAPARVPVQPDRLDELAALVPVPPYDRGALQVGIVHLGVGGFHRAHLAAYVDALLRRGEARDWAICGVGVLASDAAMRDVLQRQAGLYTLVTKHPDGTDEPRVIGSVVRYLFAPDDAEAVVQQLSLPGVRIASLTVTEGGYDVDAGSAEVQADLQPGAVPRTAFGLVVEALARRRAAGTAPFTVVSCDNVAGNGEVARRSVVALARLRDAGLADWIEAQVAFPSSMVDRITPATTDADRAALAADFGVDDGWPVVCEPFSQWVLEDRFPTGRPRLEQVGVQLVDDVEPYELMKLRLLNAGHQVLAYLGRLLGWTQVHEASSDPVLARFLLDYMACEAAPSLPPVPGVDLPAYERELVERFGNPQVGDTLARLCAYSSDRIPAWLLPVVQHNLAHGGQVRRAATVVAAWARYAEGLDEHGRELELVDHRAERLRAAATAQGADPLAFLRDRELFGELVEDPRFTTPYLRALDRLHGAGARALLDELVEGASCAPLS